MGAVSLMTSCSNESLDAQSDSVMLEAEVNSVAKTRAAVEGSTLPEGSNYGLYVYQDYKIVADNLKMNEKSTATGYMITGDNKVKVAAYYPYSEKAVEYEDAVTIYPGTTDYLHTVSSETYTKSNPKASIQLHHALARVRFNVTAASDATGSFKVSLSGIERVYTKGSMRLGIVGSEVYGHTNAVDIVKFDKPLNDEIKAGTTISTEVFLLPQSLKEMEPYFFFTVDGESKGISADIVNATTSGKWESGKVYTYNITINEGKRLSVTSATIEEWGEVEELKGVTAEEFVAIADGHEYVDLGLPSGTLWATCNIGASSPEEYGDYFAWGETETKTSFDSNNYKWLTKGEGWTKYNEDEESGIVDNINELELEDDAAHVKWGGRWCMPNHENFEELKENCVYYMWEYEGVMGLKVSSKVNDNYIFLPIASYYDGTTSSGYTGYGYYWSSSLSSRSSYFGCLLEFHYSITGRLNMDIDSYLYRYYGLPIRPVIR